MKKNLSLWALCFLSGIAAADGGTSSPYSACMDKAAGVTSDMLDCIASETKNQDDRLNKAYKSASADLEADRVKQLQQAQRAWIKYRDANCNFYADPHGGTAATLNSNSCFLKATENRAKELEGVADGLK